MLSRGKKLALLQRLTVRIMLADEPKPTFAERHYSVQEVAEMWDLSPDAVRRIFSREPGVLVLESQTAPGKRRYRVLRIPESVAERVHRRCSNADTVPSPSQKLRAPARRPRISSVPLPSLGSRSTARPGGSTITQRDRLGRGGEAR